MTTMSITFEDPSIASALNKLVKNMYGVKKVTISSDTVSKTPNSATRSAIVELRSGKGARCKNVDELFEQLNS
jgi:hypothetical protein